MSENQNIEAKLCSYIEGDLDAAGRAEIEKYLLANPEYRPLIAELSRTRGLLRGLPRASAPAELLETLSGQIERSALLGNDDGGPAHIRSASRIPQLVAWAAVLALTVGLAAVVYRVLPSNKNVAMLKPAPQSAIATQPVDEEKKSAVEVAQVPTDRLQVDQLQADKSIALAKQEQQQNAPPSAAMPVPVDGEPRKQLTLQTAASTPVVDAAAAPALAEADKAVGSLDQKFAANFTARSSISSGTAVNAASPQQQTLGSIIGGDATQAGQNMYVTLRATDARAAGARVTRYLSDNGIRFDSPQMNAGARVSAGPLPASTLQAGAITNGSVSPANSVLDGVGDGNDSILLPTQDGSESRRALKSEQSAAAGVPSATFRNPPATTNPAAQQLPAPQETASVIIARNLTPEQARQLESDLAVKVLPAEVRFQPATQPIPVYAASAPAANTLQPGQNLRIIARDNGLPGVEAMNETQTIDADGNVTLPMVGKLKAAGLTDAQLALAIPQAYRNANSPTSATWEIDRLPADVPTTAPVLSLTPASPLAGGTALVQAATQPVAAALEKDQKGYGVGGSAGGGGAGGAAGRQLGIDVTITVVPQPIAKPQNAMSPTTQPTPEFQAALPASPPATTLPATAP